MGDFMSDIENNNIKKIFGAEKLNGLKSDDLVNIKSKEDIQYEKDFNQAMKLYDKISDIFTEEKVTLEAAYTVCMAMAECIYQYMLFGDTSEEN